VTEIAKGCVVHWTNFQFEDGSERNKFFVVLSCKPGCNWLFVIATSKQKRRAYNAGCSHEDGYYHIPGGSRDFFTKDTWLLLMKCLEVNPMEARKLLAINRLKVAGSLREQVANEIRNCLKRCDDASANHIALL
jgi:hypothetical protein